MENKAKFYSAISFFAAYRKLKHGYSILISESYDDFLEYLEKIKKKDKSKAGKMIPESKNIQEILEILQTDETEHPKVSFFLEIIERLNKNGKSCIVFISQKSTARILKKKLEEMNIKSELVFGGKGKNVKKNQQILKNLKTGEVKILLATSVIEEGISVAEVDYIVHYSMPKRGISRIQRDGRTGRENIGFIIYLILNHVLDKAAHWSSFNKAKKMKEIIKTL